MDRHDAVVHNPVRETYVAKAREANWRAQQRVKDAAVKK